MRGIQNLLNLHTPLGLFSQDLLNLHTLWTFFYQDLTNFAVGLIFNLPVKFGPNSLT